ncbi:MAG: dTDP-glucose 4,6-dehydratase [Saprospiraceae bacterium]|nr:dTDP-glucose 4,6-dehydratase [Saprospiraceae bacterium]
MNQNIEKRILITGGAGFIGSHLVRRLVHQYPMYKIINLDALTYAGNLANLKDIESNSNYKFILGDIRDIGFIKNVYLKEGITDIIHLAAESHVDRSISDPSSFVQTNVLGTANLLIASIDAWKENYPAHRFHHVSTDEVFGSLGPEGKFTETTPYDPRSPYSASKAGSDHLVRAFGHTFGLNTVITNCSNNYGPNQFPEKLMPLIIRNIILSKPLPVYGKGENIRDWLWVEDHTEAIDLVFHKGISGQTYNIGGNSEMKNIDIVMTLCELGDELLQRVPGTSKQLIQFVNDRPGHDMRYAIDISKIKNQLGWNPKIEIKLGLRKTFLWYLNNNDWLDSVTSGDYMEFYKKHYSI